MEDTQSFGSLAEFEASLSPESKAQFRDAQLILEQTNGGTGTGSLWLGGQFAARDSTTLRERGTTHILTCNGRRPWLFGLDHIDTKTIDWDDIDSEQLQPELDEGVLFIENALTKGGVVLVHCTAGRSRSVAVVVAYLIRHRKLTYDDALLHVQSIRPWATPNKGFELQLRTYWEEYQSPVNCELCQLEKNTDWYYEHKDFVIIECDQCDQPMAVWRIHTLHITKEAEECMEKELCRVADDFFKDGQGSACAYYIDKKQRSIGTHLHWHARKGRPPFQEFLRQLKNSGKL